MREVVGRLAPEDFPQARWVYNAYTCDDAYDAASQEKNLLLVDAHGWEDPEEGGWLMELLDGVVSVEWWVREQSEETVFLNVCNPAGRRIRPRPGQTVIYPLSAIRGPGSAALVESRGQNES